MEQKKGIGFGFRGWMLATYPNYQTEFSMLGMNEVRKYFLDGNAFSRAMIK